MTSPRIWRTLLPLFVAAFWAFSYNNIFMTVTPLFALSCSLSMIEAGAQTTIFLAVAVILRFAFGPVADRIGTKPVMLTGMAAFVAGAVVFVGASDYASIIIARCIQAVGLAAFWSCATATVCDVSPVDKQGWYLGLYRLVTSASLLIGPVLAFELIEHTDYRTCFFVLGACALCALCALVLMPKPPAPAAPAAATAPSPTTPATARHAHFAPLLQNKVLWLVVVCTFCAAMGYGLIFSFAATYIDAHFAALNSGLYFTVLGIGGLVGNPLAGWISDRISQKTELSIWLVCMGLGLGSLCLVPLGVAALYASGVLVGLSYAGVITSAQSLTSSCTLQQHRATAFAFQQNAIDLGIALASSAFGVIFASVGASSSFPFIGQGALVIMIGIVVILSARKR